MHINNLEKAVKVKTQLAGARRVLKDMESGIIVSTRANPGLAIPVTAETLATITKLLSFDAGVAEQDLCDELTELGVEDADEEAEAGCRSACEEPVVSVHIMDAGGVHPAHVIADIIIGQAVAAAKAGHRPTLG